MIKNPSNLVRLFEQKAMFESRDHELVEAIQKTNEFISSMKDNSSRQIINETPRDSLFE